MHGPVFQWLSTSPHIPIRWDLRLADWSMRHVVDERATAGGLPVVLDWRRNSRLPRWQGMSTPARVVAVGVDDPRERTFLLARGLGDAIGSRVTHVELEARLTRIGHRARALPRELHAGPVTLDLFQRDGRAGGRWLGLHPREFALLWRLAETPGASVTRAQLLRVLGWQNVDPDSSLFSLGLVSVQAAILLESVKEVSAALLPIYAAAMARLDCLIAFPVTNPAGSWSHLIRRHSIRPPLHQRAGPLHCDSASCRKRARAQNERRRRLGRAAQRWAHLDPPSLPGRHPSLS